MRFERSCKRAQQWAPRQGSQILEWGDKFVTKTSTIISEDFTKWRARRVFFFPIYVLKGKHRAILYDRNITSPLWLTRSVLMSLVLPTRRQAFPQMGKQITKCSRKTTLFSSNVEHVYRPPGRHKQRGTTSNLLGWPLFSCQPVYSPSRLTTPQWRIRLQLCGASVVAGSSSPLRLCSLWKASRTKSTCVVILCYHGCSFQLEGFARTRAVLLTIDH